MSPTVGPDLVPTPPLSGYQRPTLLLKRTSTSSLQSEPDNVTIGTSPAYSSSNVSIPFEDGDVDVVRVEGLRHSNIRLEARRYKFPAFAVQLLDILHTLRTPSWSNSGITPDRIEIQKVSGSMTNAVFFVSCPSVPGTRIVLLRIYGPSSGSMISRPRELQILHVLSSQYHIGPRVYGTFENGRVEEYFDATTLTADDLRDKMTSVWIAARMAELHTVDIKAVELVSTLDAADDNNWVAAKTNVQSWFALAREVLALPGAPQSARSSLDLDRLHEEWERYTCWLDEQEKIAGPSPRVFAHNDTQYGNLLRLKTLKEGMSKHQRIIVVDFEYASPNPAAFDIANHFHEWTANYHSDTAHILDPALYPTEDQRRNFYRSYLRHIEPNKERQMSTEELEAKADTLESQVRAWSPASHAMWALWGIIQAREFVEGSDGDPEFDYLGYSQCRLDGFRRELHALGL